MQAKSTTLKILDLVSVLLLAVALYLALIYAPEELQMGQVQRVFYFHVATAWTALLGFVAAGVAGIAYLVTKNPKWDIVEVAAVEISLVFFLITIVLVRFVWRALMSLFRGAEHQVARAGLDGFGLSARDAFYVNLGGLAIPNRFIHFGGSHQVGNAGAGENLPAPRRSRGENEHMDHRSLGPQVLKWRLRLTWTGLGTSCAR